ncbi:MAG: 16S rRNA (uracil(1498)-N(3))-methyltransferase [Betaproteobacteria bacterium]|nr:16S rRNA (uracil(1498)-N(3))-methyltransferase [Betaproteobacteria bacterium]
MSAPRFHCALPLVAGQTVTLPAEAFHHAVRVRRLRAGDELVLFAGDGCEAAATLAAVTRDTADAAILAVRAVDRESPLQVTLLQGLSAGDRMDYTLQKAVELGVSAIVPVATRRSVVRLDRERADKRQAHWRQILIGACEQSGRNRIPEVLPVVSLAAALAGVTAARRFVLSFEGGARVCNLETPAGPIALLAGPEGGLTADEERLARDAWFAPLSLGPRVLRTETAAVAALAAMQALWGDG